MPTLDELRELDAQIAGKVMAWTLLGKADCEHEPECGSLEIVPLNEPSRQFESHPVYLERCRCENYPVQHVVYPDGPMRPIEIEVNTRNAQEHDNDLNKWGHSRSCLGIVPRYSSDISAAMEVENRIEQLHLIREYVRALEHIGDMATPSRVITDTGVAWRLAHATPEQRCRAALKAVEDNPDRYCERQRS